MRQLLGSVGTSQFVNGVAVSFSISIRVRM